MEWERFFSQSQSSNAPTGTPVNNYDSTRNQNPVANVGVNGTGRSGNTGVIGSGRMGANYSIPSASAGGFNSQNQGQNHNQNQSQNQSQTPIISASGLRDPFVNPLPTTYGGVERANQLLRSLHEQPSDPSDNTYYPSSQPQVQSLQQIGQQRAIYDPLSSGPLGLNTASNRPTTNQNAGPGSGTSSGSAGNYPRGNGYEARQGQGVALAVSGSGSRLDDSVYQKPSTYQVSQNQSQGQHLMDQVSNPQSGGYRNQDLLSTTQGQGQGHYQGQSQSQNQNIQSQSQSASGGYRPQQIPGQLPSSLQSNYRGHENQSTDQFSHSNQSIGSIVDIRGGDSRYSSSLPQQQGQGQGLGQGQGQGQRSQSIQGQGQGLGQGQGQVSGGAASSWQHSATQNRIGSTAVSGGHNQQGNDYTPIGGGDGGRYPTSGTNRDYNQSGTGSGSQSTYTPSTSQSYNTTIQSQQQQTRYSQPVANGLVVGDVRYKAPEVIRESYPVQNQNQAQSPVQGSASQNQNQNQNYYSQPVKASVTPQYQQNYQEQQLPLQQHTQQHTQQQSQQLPAQQQSQFSQQSHSQGQGQLGKILQGQGQQGNVPQQYQALQARTQDAPYIAPLIQQMNNSNQIDSHSSQGQSQGLGQGQTQGPGQYQSQYIAPQQQQQQQQQQQLRAPSRFNLPQGNPQVASQQVPVQHAQQYGTAITETNVLPQGRYGQPGSYFLSSINFHNLKYLQLSVSDMRENCET